MMKRGIQTMLSVLSECTCAVRKQNSAAIFALLACTSVPAVAGGKSDPMVGFIGADRFERQFYDEGSATILEGTAWLGHDLEKFWINYDIEYSDGTVEEAEVDYLYHRAISTYWNLQAGVRQVLRPDPVDYGFVVGIEGTAPYFIETQSHLTAMEDGVVQLSIEAEKEWMLTQHWIIVTEFSGNFYDQTDEEKEIGSGLSDTELSLRLHYSIKPDLAPYIGINWVNYWNDRKELVEAENSPTSDWAYTIGINFWF